jgi:hypothetical protein
VCTRHFANPAKNRLHFGRSRICKNGRFSAGAEIRYSPIGVHRLRSRTRVFIFISIRLIFLNTMLKTALSPRSRGQALRRHRGIYCWQAAAFVAQFVSTKVHVVGHATLAIARVVSDSKNSYASGCRMFSSCIRVIQTRPPSGTTKCCLTCMCTCVCAIWLS